MYNVLDRGVNMIEYTKNQVHEVACAFNEHKIIALPTDTVYGVGVKYGNLDDLERLKRAKHRPETKPIPMMVSNVEQMKQVALVDERIEKIAAKFLPGALTLVVNVKESVDPAYTNGLSTIAIRIPDEKFILDVIDELNCPILVTSANQSGEKTALTSDDVYEQLPKIDINDYYRDVDGEYKTDFEYIATEIRLKFGIGRGPISNIIKLLEEKGIIIHFFDYDFISSDNNKFDGVSFYVKGTPVILVNNKVPNSRKVFTIAHELGHLLLHFDDMISIERDIENEANSFASAFLAPAKDIKSSLRQLNIDKLKSLKIEWNMSIASLVYRAYALGTISQQTLRFWMMKLSPIRKNEPLEFEIDNPKLLKKLFQVLEEQTENGIYKHLGFTEKLRSELFGKDNIPQRTKLKIVLD